MSGNYREYGYDVNSPKLSRQIQEDISEAKEIEKRAEEIRSKKGEEITKDKLGKEEVTKEEIEAVLNNYASNENEYLVNGAILTCDKAKRGSVKIKIGNAVVEFEGNNSMSYKYARLNVKENGQSDNGLYVATIGDAEKDVNIVPFRCNCSLLPDRQWEIDKIKNNLNYCKTYGTCSQLMDLDDEWDNLPSDTSYFTYTDVSKDGSEEKEAINMMSMLFCKHGGLITPVISGQTKEGNTGKFVGYLSYGCKSITQNPDEGYYMLYDGPTVDSVGEVYMFSDIYDMSGERAKGALQGYGGSAGLNTLEDTIRYVDQQNYNFSKGTLCYKGIDRHTIAIGPALQNLDFTLTASGGVKGTEMIYGTCVDITIEFEGKEYYIPAVVVDCKAHTAPAGYVQTGESFSGEQAGGDKGNIVEWYVFQGKDGQNKSTGLNQFTNDGGIIIYRDEVALEE